MDAGKRHGGLPGVAGSILGGNFVYINAFNSVIVTDGSGPAILTDRHQLRIHEVTGTLQWGVLGSDHHMHLNMLLQHDCIGKLLADGA